MVTRVQELQKQFYEWLKDERAESVKKRQNVFFFSGLSLMIILILSIVFMRSLGSSHEHMEDSAPIQKRTIETAKASVDQKKVWVDRLESEMDIIKKKNDQLEQLVTTLAKKQIGQAPQNEFDPSLAPSPPKEMNNNFSLDVPFSSNTLSTKHLTPNVPLNQEDTPNLIKAERGYHAKKFAKITFNLEGADFNKPKKSIEHYVPAGTFVKARLVSGVVASTAVGSSSDPQPIHMEMTDFGNLPRGFKTDLKRCFLIGSAYGDLASERVFMRLETLSCVERKTQEVIELKVDGYVSGEDGANGMRGQIIDKSGPAMRNAFLGGFLSGVGGFISDKNSGSTQISPIGMTTQNALSASELLKGGAGKGVGNAMEKMSDFYIKRAEQLQPVIEIEPGRVIDVVFKAGFDMNQTLYRQSLKNRQDRTRQVDVSKEFE